MAFNLNIYRNGVVTATVSINEQTKLVKKLMNADRITASFVANKNLPLELGDYVVFQGRNYYLNSVPTTEKQNANTFKYTAIFQSELYDMYRKLLISADGLTEFSYVANPTEFITMLVESLNSVFAGWTVGDVDDGLTLTIDFSNDSCRTALTKIADAYKYEFEVVGKTIHFKEAIGELQPYTFEYGKNAGLYSITRKGVDNARVATRVYGFGGTKNIPYTYRNRAKRLVFEERYLDKNTAIFGIRETHYVNEDIYPKRTGTITASNMVFSNGAYSVNSYIEDNTLDFNINEALAEGQTAKIVFKSGALAGSQFELWKYDHDNKRMYMNPFTEGDGYTLPNETQKVEVGDTYTLVDMNLPAPYVIQAEADLKAATQKYLDENCVPKSLYLVKLDPKEAKAQAVSLDAGDLVNITDPQLGIDRAIRVAQVTITICNPYKIEAIIADFIPYTLQEQVTINTKQNDQVISNIQNIVNNAITQNNNTTTNVTNNTTTVINNGTDLQKIDINGQEFWWEKGFDNTGDALEVGDIIFGNNWNRFVFVDKWVYKGGIKELRASWDELETTDNTPVV